MRNRLLLLALVPVTAALGAPPAVAAPAVRNGLSCGVETVVQGYQHVTTLSGGPVAAENPEHLIMVECWAYVVYDGVAQVIASGHSDLSQGVAVMRPTVTVGTLPSAAPMNIHVCTEVTVHGDGQVTTDQYDADGDPSNGAQCDTASSTGNGDTTVWFAPPHNINEVPCIVVSHQVIGQRGICPTP